MAFDLIEIVLDPVLGGWGKRSLHLEIVNDLFQLGSLVLLSCWKDLGRSAEMFSTSRVFVH